MQQEGGDMNEVASLRACGIFSSCAPAYFAAPGEDVCDRLLLSMMMNSCPANLGSTSNRPPQMAEAMPNAGAIAARRSEPGVCAVPESNWTGLTMWIAGDILMVSRIIFEKSIVLKLAWAGRRTIK